VRLVDDQKRVRELSRHQTVRDRRIDPHTDLHDAVNLRMVRDAEVFARGRVRHSDHKTIRPEGWHRVYLNRERFARHATQIAFLD
jgi:hypothetical protein